MKDHPNIVYGGAIPYSQVMKVINQSDILLVVEGFNKIDVDITRYSLSTKVADLLAVGGAVLSLGSIECGAIEYMKEIDCGPVCTDFDGLDDCIKKLLYDVDYQKNNYKKASAVSKKNHELVNSNQVFEEIVEKAINKYRKDQEK